MQRGKKVIRALVVIGIGVIVVVGAIGLNFLLLDEDELDGAPPERFTAAPAETAATQPVPRTDETKPATPASTDSGLAPQAKAPDVGGIRLERRTAPGEAAASRPDTDKGLTKPAGEAGTAAELSFDVVRVTPKGEAVLAGRAHPGSHVIIQEGENVIIQEGENVIGEVTANSRGEWVFVPDAPQKPGSRRLGLKMEIEGQAPVLSEPVVVLVVPEIGKDIGGEPAKGESRALVLKVPRDGSGTSVVLQRPESTTAQTFQLMVDIVDYDDRGLVTISGHAAAGGIVHVYLNNAFIGRAESDAGGAWSMQPNQLVEPGLYTLRADQVDESGKVLARVSMPFSRAEPLTTMAAGTYVIVQPGNSLWRIARRSYGTGFAYSVIFKANLDQIRDADMIFPGQIFSLPATN